MSSGSSKPQARLPVRSAPSEEPREDPPLLPQLLAAPSLKLTADGTCADPSLKALSHPLYLLHHLLFSYKIEVLGFISSVRPGWSCLKTLSPITPDGLLLNSTHLSAGLESLETEMSSQESHRATDNVLNKPQKERACPPLVYSKHTRFKSDHENHQVDADP